MLLGWTPGHDWEPDRVITHCGRLLLFTDLPHLAAHARQNATADQEPAPVYDLNRVRRWIFGHPGHVPCAMLLDLWNLAQDVAVSTGKGLNTTGPATDTLYDKLFHGCNLPALTPPGRCYTPWWTPTAR